MGEWEDDLKALLARHAAGGTAAEQHHEARQEDAQAFMEQHVRPAFAELADVFARSGHGHTVDAQFSPEPGGGTGPAPAPAVVNAPEHAWAQLTVLHGTAEEFVYRVQLTFTPESLVLRKEVSNPADPTGSLVKTDFALGPTHPAADELTREDLIRDFLDEYRQCLEGPTP